MDEISSQMMGHLSHAISTHYTASEIEALFLYAGAPDRPPESSKAKTVLALLRATNTECAAPLEVLGKILNDFVSRERSGASKWNGGEDAAAELTRDQAKAVELLCEEGFELGKGGRIAARGAQASPTHSLVELVAAQGLSAVDTEIQRALARVDDDPNAAAHYAGNTLEAVFKAYLRHQGLGFAEGATLSDLWRDAAAAAKMKPKDLENGDLKKIASELHSIVEGIMRLRNAKSGAHGKSEEQARRYKIEPRHARLAIHASHSVAAYFVELMH